MYLLLKQFSFSDGDLIGQPPIEVFCNLETKTTEVLHDFEFQIKIEHCEEIGCAVYNISYSAPMDQIKSLIQLSESCSQSLDFGCFLAPLQEEGVDLGFWADRDGKMEKKSLYLFFFTLVANSDTVVYRFNDCKYNVKYRKGPF